MVNYQNAKIYKMENINGLVYIGSTCEKLSVRKAKHKCDYKRWKAGKMNFLSCFLLYDDDIDTEIYLVENFPCNSIEELRKREGEIIKSCECVNRRIEGRNNKMYKEEHKERLAVLYKEYRRVNKERLSASRRRRVHCLCGRTYARNDKGRHERSNFHCEKVKALNIFKEKDKPLYDAIVRCCEVFNSL